MNNFFSFSNLILTDDFRWGWLFCNYLNTHIIFFSRAILDLYESNRIIITLLCILSKLYCWCLYISNFNHEFLYQLNWYLFLVQNSFDKSSILILQLLVCSNYALAWCIVSHTMWCYHWYCMWYCMCYY